MKTKICNRQLWEAPPWSLYLETRGLNEAAKVYRPERPFVLIGASERCDIRLDEPQLPSVAYIACCFSGTVEVWPTSAIAIRGFLDENVSNEKR